MTCLSALSSGAIVLFLCPRGILKILEREKSNILLKMLLFLVVHFKGVLRDL